MLTAGKGKGMPIAELGPGLTFRDPAMGWEGRKLPDLTARGLDDYGIFSLPDFDRLFFPPWDFYLTYYR